MKHDTPLGIHRVEDGDMTHVIWYRWYIGWVIQQYGIGSEPVSLPRNWHFTLLITD